MWKAECTCGDGGIKSWPFAVILSIHRYRREQQEQPNDPRIELHDPQVHAEENLYEQTVDNLHYVSVSPQPIPDNISVASGEGGEDEAGGGSEGGEARETGATSGGEDLNLDNNQSKHLINRQSEPKIIGIMPG